MLSALALEHFEHPQSQAYTWNQMKCLCNCGAEGLLLSSQYCLKVSTDTSKPAVESIFHKRLLHSFTDIPAKYALWDILPVLTAK